MAKSYRTDVCVGLLPFPSFSSPHLAAFLIFFICQAAQLLALSPPAQDPLDFFPAKELCTVPKPGLLTSARPFPFLSLQLTPFPPTPALSSNLLHLCALGVFNQPSPRCRRFICIFRGSGLSINQVYLSKGAIIAKYNNISVSVCHFHFCFSAQAD